MPADPDTDHNEHVESPRFSRRHALGLAGSGTAALALAVAIRQTGPPDQEISGASSTGAARSDGAVAVEWFDLIADLIRTTPGFAPPAAARALGYAGITLWEAVVPGTPGARSLAGRLSGFEGAPSASVGSHSTPVAANHALARVVRRLFDNVGTIGTLAIDALERDLALDLGAGLGAEVVGRSRRLGQGVADSIAAWAAVDGGGLGGQGRTGTAVVPEGPGLWAPTPPDYNAALWPAWGTNRTFLPGIAMAADATPPPPFSTATDSAFGAEALEVYEAVRGLTSEQRQIARFWADEPGATATPAGHSASILTQVLRRRRVPLDRVAEVYARLGIALSDAFICCWDTKYRHWLVRPIAYIRTHIDPTWGEPLPVSTPPFPEYTSGHSVQSGAAERVLTQALGVSTFTDRTHERLGLRPRRFASFAAFAEEAAVSRLYGGIHYRSAIEEGLRQGRRIGDAANALPFH